MTAKKGVATDTTKISVAVLGEHLKGIDNTLTAISEDVKGVKEQFIALNGKVNKHASELAVINSQDLEKRIGKQESFSNKVIGGLMLLGAGNVVVVLKLIFG